MMRFLLFLFRPMPFLFSSSATPTSLWCGAIIFGIVVCVFKTIVVIAFIISLHSLKTTQESALFWSAEAVKKRLCESLCKRKRNRRRERNII
jgi:hypothetical protein